MHANGKCKERDVRTHDVKKSKNCRCKNATAFTTINQQLNRIVLQ